MANRIEILNGPSRDALWESMKVKGAIREVFFQTEDLAFESVPARIIALKVAHPFRDWWLFEAMAFPGKSEERRINGLFNSLEREGWLEGL